MCRLTLFSKYCHIECGSLKLQIWGDTMQSTAAALWKFESTWSLIFHANFLFKFIMSIFHSKTKIMRLLWQNNIKQKEKRTIRFVLGLPSYNSRTMSPQFKNHSHKWTELKIRILPCTFFTIVTSRISTL